MGSSSRNMRKLSGSNKSISMDGLVNIAETETKMMNAPRRTLSASSSSSSSSCHNDVVVVGTGYEDKASAWQDRKNRRNCVIEIKTRETRRTKCSMNLKNGTKRANSKHRRLLVRPPLFKLVMV